MAEQEEDVIQHGERFMETVVALKNGAVLQEMGERLAILVEAVRSTEKSGSLTVTLKVVPVSGSGEVVTVEADIKEKVPRPSLGKTMFYTDEPGRLLRENPKQLTFRMEKQ